MFDMKIIARVRSGFDSKFGIPRQSGLAGTKARIVFEPEYSDPDAFRGIEGYSHLWVLWGFSLTASEGWSATVRPPRLGGNERRGVFASRSPYRPNPIGLSSVRLERIEYTKTYGVVLHISGGDMADGTPVFDIKPYLAYTDSHPDAASGFADTGTAGLKVYFAEGTADVLPSELQKSVADILACDPRPGYIKDETRLYGMSYCGYEIKFRVRGDALTVEQIENARRR